MNKTAWIAFLDEHFPGWREDNWHAFLARWRRALPNVKRAAPGRYGEVRQLLTQSPAPAAPDSPASPAPKASTKKAVSPPAQPQE